MVGLAGHGKQRRGVQEGLSSPLCGEKYKSTVWEWRQRIAHLHIESGRECRESRAEHGEPLGGRELTNCEVVAQRSPRRMGVEGPDGTPCLWLAAPDGQKGARGTWFPVLVVPVWSPGAVARWPWLKRRQNQRAVAGLRE